MLRQIIIRQKLMAFFDGLTLSAPILWICVAACLLGAHVSSLLQFYSLVLFFLGVATVVLSAGFLKGGALSVLAAAPVLVGTKYYIGREFNWDVVSYELPNYYDFLDHTKGAYWTYSILPDSLFGAAINFGVPGLVFVYGFTLLLFACSLYILLSCLPKDKRLFVSAILAVILTSALRQVFHLCKGDLLGAAVGNVVVYFFLKFFDVNFGENKVDGNRCGQEDNHVNFFCVMMFFSALAVSAKSGLLFIVFPMCLIVFLKLMSVCPRIVLSRKIIAVLIFSVLSFVTFFVKLSWWGFAALKRDSNFDEGMLSSLFHSHRHFLFDGYRTPTLVPVFLMAMFIVPLFAIVGRKDSDYSLALRLVIYFIMAVSMYFMPFAALSGPDSIENIRLLTLPIVSLVMVAFL